MHKNIFVQTLFQDNQRRLQATFGIGSMYELVALDMSDKLEIIGKRAASSHTQQNGYTLAEMKKDISERWAAKYSLEMLLESLKYLEGRHGLPTLLSHVQKRSVTELRGKRTIKRTEKYTDENKFFVSDCLY